jgi:hypothetical protein
MGPAASSAFTRRTVLAPTPRGPTAGVTKGSQIVAAEATAWNNPHSHYRVSRIDHGEACGPDGISSNQAERFRSRLRCAEQGRFHHVAGLRRQTGPWRRGPVSAVDGSK